jgi:hypothetical protein
MTERTPDWESKNGSSPPTHNRRVLGVGLMVAEWSLTSRPAKMLDGVGQPGLRQALPVGPLGDGDGHRGGGGALGDLRARPVGPVELRAQVLVELRAVAGDAGADGVEGLDRVPPGLGVLSISGGMAPSSTTLATREVPWRPM